MVANAIQMIPLAVDPPKHADYRRVLDPMFGPKRIDAMEPDLRAQVRSHIDAFAPLGRCDVVTDLSYKFPTQAILTLFGLPLEQLPQFLDWATGIIKDANITNLGQEPPQRVIDCSIALFGFLAEQLEAKRSHPGNDMLSSILALDGDDAWTDAEILGLCFLVVLAGLDTVTGAIGYSLLNLATDPELRHRLIADPALIGPFVEEVLRLDGPVPGVPRLTTCDVEVEGVTIPADSAVMLMLGTANREVPSAADAPHEMNLSCQAHPSRVRRRNPPLPRLAPGAPGAAADHRGVPRPHPGLPAGRRGAHLVARRHFGPAVAAAGVRALLTSGCRASGPAPRPGPGRSRVRRSRRSSTSRPDPPAPRHWRPGSRRRGPRLPTTARSWPGRGRRRRSGRASASRLARVGRRRW